MRTGTLFLALCFLQFCRPKTEDQNLFQSMPDPWAFYIPDSFKYLLPILDSVLLRDQQYRALYVGTEREKREKEKYFLEHAGEVGQLDRQNLVIVEGILSRHGWLSYRQVGMNGYMAIFMVIQHADLATQEKYLPMIAKALKTKDVLVDHYAMLADRVEIRNKRPQQYGTQLRIINGEPVVLPLLNPDSVNTWRKKIGMFQTLEQYVKRFDGHWDKELYQQQLPALKKQSGL